MRFPPSYVTQQLNSKQSIKNTQSGNCVALCQRLKLQLKKLYDIDSYLIPATVPSYIYKEGYLTIASCSLIGSTIKYNLLFDEIPLFILWNH